MLPPKPGVVESSAIPPSNVSVFYCSRASIVTPTNAATLPVLPMLPLLRQWLTRVLWRPAFQLPIYFNDSSIDCEEWRCRNARSSRPFK